MAGGWRQEEQRNGEKWRDGLTRGREERGEKRSLVDGVRSRSWNFRNLGKGVGKEGRDRRGRRACRGVWRERLQFLALI